MGGEETPTETFRYQAGNEAGVIQMCMRKDDGVQAAWIELKGKAISSGEFRATLDETAIYKDALGAVLHEKA